MRIEQYNTQTQSRIFSGTGKIGNVSLPDYTDFHFCTKTVPKMSDSEYKSAIEKQAKKDQATGKFQSDSPNFRNLMKSYVSVESPDRKNIISEGLTVIYKNNKHMSKTLNLIDYLFGSVKYEKQANNNLNYAEFYDKSGNMVASFSNGGGTFYGTKAENSREIEACMIYNAAWNNAAKSINGNAIIMEMNQGTFDVSV